MQKISPKSWLALAATLVVVLAVVFTSRQASTPKNNQDLRGQAAGSPSLFLFPTLTNLYLTPNTLSNVEVRFNPGGSQIRGAEMVLNFDPNVLQMVSSSGAPATAVLTGNVFGIQLQNVVDNTTGKISLAMSTYSAVTGTTDSRFALIIFKVKSLPAGGQTVLKFSPAPATQIVAVGGSVVGTATGGTIKILADAVAPPVPSPGAPVGGTQVGSRTPNFNWPAVFDKESGTAFYGLQVAKDQGFSQVLYSNLKISPSSGSTMAFTLPAGAIGADGDYYWRLLAVDQAGNQSSWSPPAAFTVLTTAPAKISDLRAGQVTANSAEVSWTAPVNGLGESTYMYDLRFATKTITSETDWSAANQLNCLVSLCPGMPKAPGSAETASVKELSAGATYYLAIRSKDVLGNWSPISNVVTVQTLAVQPVELGFKVAVQGVIVQPAQPGLGAVLTLTDTATGGSKDFILSLVYDSTDGQKAVYQIPGFVLLGIEPGVYKVRLKGARELGHWLGTQPMPAAVPAVTLARGQNNFDWTAVTLLGGDANDDNTINMQDFDILARDFKSTAVSPADFNFDGRVNLADFDFIATNFKLTGN